MLAHARGEAPLECCGLLVGRSPLMDGLLPCVNERRSASLFSIPPAQLLRSFQEIRSEGRQLLGIYHSHPAGPEHPSARDTEEFEYPGVSYWIVSLCRPVPVVRCYQWTGSGFEGTSFEVVEAAEPPSERFREAAKGGLS